MTKKMSRTAWGRGVEKKEILFVVAGPASKFLEGEQEKVDTDEFILSGAKISLRHQGKDIRIELK
jgi:hypothetical protein